MMREHKCQVMCLQETWSQTKLTTKNLFGMTYHRLGVEREARGRGIGIIVDPLLNFRVEKSLCVVDEGIELLTIRQPDGGMISSVYVPSNSVAGLQDLFETLTSAAPTYPFWLIIGDFNANHERWSQGSNNRNGTLLAEFLDNHEEFSRCFPQEPTCSSGDRSTTIDLGILSSQVSNELFDMMTVESSSYGVTTPHKMVIGNLKTSSVKLLHRVKQRFEKELFT